MILGVLDGKPRPLTATREFALVTVLMVASSVACGGASTGSTPKRSSPKLTTSLGTLAEVERRTAADSANPALSPKADQVAYHLTFKGDIVITDFEEGWEKRVPLVDAQGREYPPILAGAPGADGTLSQDAFKLDGSMTASGGRFVFKGTARVTGGVLILAYVVP